MIKLTERAAAAGLPLYSASAFAEEVDLPFPFLEWSVYVLLIFGLVVAIGIFLLVIGAGIWFHSGQFEPGGSRARAWCGSGSGLRG